VDGTPKHRNKAAFSNFSSVMWTGTKQATGDVRDQSTQEREKATITQEKIASVFENSCI